MVVMDLYLVHYDSLLQNTTDIITKCDFYYKIITILLQKSFFITKYVSSKPFSQTRIRE